MAKKHGMALLLLFAAASLLFPQSGGKRVALVIGNGAYTTVPRLVNPSNDAQDIGDSLKRLGFDVTVKTDADRRSMRTLMDQFGDSMRGAEIALFFYSGHGVQLNGENYLVPVGAEVTVAEDMQEEGVPLQRIVARMNAAGAGTNMIILDACRNNPFPAMSHSGERGLAVVGQKPPESVIVYSTESGETAEDGKGRNGTFTTSLLKHIERKESFVDILLDVNADVRAITMNRQKPAKYDNLTKKIYLGGAAAPATVAAAPLTPSTAAGRTGDLFISTDPADADITVDGVNQGTSPLFLSGLPLHRTMLVEARKGGMSAKREIVLDKGGLTETTLRLEQQKGNLFIQCTERSVTVFLDGVKAGDFGSGLFKDVAAGKHAVELKGQGLYWKGNVEVTADFTAQLSAKPYEVGVIRYVLPSSDYADSMGDSGMSSMGSGVSARVEGDGYSRTVIGSGVLENLPVGRYRFTASGTGYADERAEVTVGRGTEAAFQPFKMGIVKIETTPSGADVYVGGRYRGTSPITITDLEKGTQTITAKLKGYEDATQSAEVQGGKTVPVSFGMKQERLRLPENMVFVQGGIFQMGDTFGDGDSDEAGAHGDGVEFQYWEVRGDGG